MLIESYKVLTFLLWFNITPGAFTKTVLLDISMLAYHHPPPSIIPILSSASFASFLVSSLT
jgi:hypothetical protein